MGGVDPGKEAPSDAAAAVGRLAPKSALAVPGEANNAAAGAAAGVGEASLSKTDAELDGAATPPAGCPNMPAARLPNGEADCAWEAGSGCSDPAAWPNAGGPEAPSALLEAVCTKPLRGGPPKLPEKMEGVEDVFAADRPGAGLLLLVIVSAAGLGGSLDAGGR